MEKLPRSKYTKEFKVQAVNMAVNDGFGLSETARRLSISLKILANWVKRFQTEGCGFTGKTDVSEAEAELSRLRRESIQLRLERDILKKTIMSHQPVPGLILHSDRGRRY